MSEELQKRFKKYEIEGPVRVVSGTLLLSDDRTLGVPLVEEEGNYFSLGTFKLVKRLKANVHVLLDKNINTELLFRAMRVLRRRKIFELGLYFLGYSQVFAVRNGKDMILLAPSVGEKAMHKFSEITGKKLKEIKEIEMWLKILQGRSI